MSRAAVEIAGSISFPRCVDNAPPLRLRLPRVRRRQSHDIKSSVQIWRENEPQVDGITLTSSLQSQRLKSWLIEPFHRALAKNPQLQSSQPFE